MWKRLAGWAAWAALSAASLGAHHSAAAEYDASRLLVLTGKVIKVEWTNPHVHWHFAVTNAKGITSDWYLEMASPNGMRRQGWLPNTVQAGDVVTVEAYGAKDFATVAKAHRIKVPDGRWLWVDSGGPNGPPDAGASK